ncbi:MAG TPA: hypothetical protein VMK42_12645 [Anaeromyxobacteraceae bacterium]|nr:hypothetical protein [Anaeromyxobacteraceae bacterium]
MRRASKDRGAFLEVAGRGRLSPALAAGAPRLAPEGDGEGRCGWEPFFTAVEARGLAVAWDPESPAQAELARAEEVRELAPRGELAAGLDRWRRFLGAWKGGPPESPG